MVFSNCHETSAHPIRHVMASVLKILHFAPIICNYENELERDLLHNFNVIIY